MSLICIGTVSSHHKDSSANFDLGLKSTLDFPPVAQALYTFSLRFCHHSTPALYYTLFNMVYSVPDASNSIRHMIEKQALHSLFPPNTLVIDFGYESSDPLRMGNFKRPLLYDGGLAVKGLKSSTEFDEYLASSGDDIDESCSEHDLEGSKNGEESILREFESTDREDFFRTDEINRKAIALFDFVPENDNEVGLREGQVIWVSYRHGQGWLVAEDPESGENGLVPEAYVDVLPDPLVAGDDEDLPKRFLPEIFNNLGSRDSEDEWVDTDFDENLVDPMARMTMKN